MQTIWVTKGLPGSGKSTWAKQHMALSASGDIKRVNKDDLRDMIDNGKWSHHNETFILRIRDLLIFEAIRSGKHIIVDDTNLCPKHIARIEEIAKALRSEGRQVRVEVEDFTNVPLNTCIERDIHRCRSVGEKVIRDMWCKYLKPKPQPPATFDERLPFCIIIDLDGTIALNNGHRGWYSTTGCFDDDVNLPVVNAISAFLACNTKASPVFVSGRKEAARAETVRFIREKTLLSPEPILYMRSDDDDRDDTVVKREIYEQHIAGIWNVMNVWDDRKKVCDMWRSLGLTVFQVAEGDF